MEISGGYVFTSVVTLQFAANTRCKANVLIDKDGRARLADFSFLRMISEEQTITLSTTGSSNGQWMSPEIIVPVDSEGLPTKASDCYSLGMVIYEILSGRTPFHQHANFAVTMRIMDGERPLRPQGPEESWFTDSIWKVLEHCWKHEPADRPSAKVVLRCLESGSLPPGFPHDFSGDVTMLDDGDQSDDASED